MLNLCECKWNGVLIWPNSRRTFDTFPVVIAITTCRREFVEIMLRLPYVDRLVFRAADYVLTIVATDINRDSLTSHGQRSPAGTLFKITDTPMRHNYNCARTTSQK